MQWDPVQEKALKDVILGSNVSTAKAKEAVETYLQNCAKKMRAYQPVTMVNMGLFYLAPQKVNKLLLRIIKSFRKGNITREQLQHSLDKYWPLYVVAKLHRPRIGRIYKFLVRRAAWKAAQTAKGA